MQFDSSMSQVAATMNMSMSDIENNVDGAGDKFNMLRDKALEMGSTTIYSASEAAEGLNILAMAGYDAYESVDMIEDVLLLAAAGSMDMASAASYVTGAMKGFNDETKDSAYYADLMAKGATLAATSVPELGDALSGVSATATSYGQTADSVTLSLLRLAEQGVVGANASTALSAAMKNLFAPTDQAKKILTELGVEAFDKTTGEARDFNDVVNELNDALSGYTDEQRTAYAQTIFGIQGFDAYNKMVVTSTEKQEEWADAIANATGSAAQQYATMTDNLTGDIASFKSALEGAQIQLSDKLMPIVRQVVQSVTNFVASGGLTKIVDTFIALAPAIGGATAAFIAYKTASSISGIVTTLTKALDGNTLSFKTLFTAMNANPFVLIATLVAGLVTALITLWNTNEGFRTAVQNIWSSITGIFSGAATSIKNAWSSVTSFFSSIWQSIRNVFSNASSVFSGIGQNIVQGIWQGIQNMVGWFTSQVKSFFSNIVSGVKNVLGIHSPSKVFAGIGEYMAEGLGEGWNDEYSKIEKSINRDLDFSGSITTSAAGSAINGTNASGFGGMTVNINIDGARYSNEQTLAERIAEELQFMFDRRAAVFGT